MSASKDFADIQRMLTDCAPGHTIRMSDHFRRIKFRGSIYPSLPKSKKIEIGHVRKMVRYFKIQECAKKHGMA
jgi:hypothetical protein